MKTFFALCVISTISCAYCGILPSSSTLVRTPSLDTAVVKSERLGGNFAYSIVENHAYSPVAPIIHSLPISYTAAPLSIRQSILQGIYGPPFFTPGVISSPIFGGIFGQGPIIGQAPVGGQGPILGDIPVQSPIVQPPQNVPQSDVPLQGTVVDEDTVSVESA